MQRLFGVLAVLLLFQNLCSWLHQLREMELWTNNEAPGYYNIEGGQPCNQHHRGSNSHCSPHRRRLELLFHVGRMHKQLLLQ